MPRGDGTGPWSAGPMTGRGLGYCNPCGMGAHGPMPRWGRRRFAGQAHAALPTIEEKRAMLESQLEAIKVELVALDRLTQERGE